MCVLPARPTLWIGSAEIVSFFCRACPRERSKIFTKMWARNMSAFNLNRNKWNQLKIMCLPKRRLQLLFKSLPVLDLLFEKKVDFVSCLEVGWIWKGLFVNTTDDFGRAYLSRWSSGYKISSCYQGRSIQNLRERETYIVCFLLSRDNIFLPFFTGLSKTAVVLKTLLYFESDWIKKSATARKKSLVL